MLPTHDEKQTNPLLVYDFEKTFGSNVWGALKSHIDSEDWTNLGGLVTRQFKEDDWTSGDRQTKRKIMCLVMLDFVVVFTKKVKNGKIYKFKPDVSMADLAEQMNAPPLVLNKIFETFGAKSPDSKNFMFSKQLHQKRTIFTLLLLLNGARETAVAKGGEDKIAITDCSSLLGAIQVEGKEASEVMRTAGVVVKRGGGKVGMSLKAPVEFPQMKRARR